MKAMVLAAGLGERMAPLSLVMPKPAIPVLGRPIILEVLRGLSRAGIREITVNLHHMGDRLAKLVSEGALGSGKIHLSPEKTILGTAGGIRHAARFLKGSGTILVRNSDFLADIDLSAAAAAHRDSDALATIVVAPARPGYSEIAVDRGGRVVSIGGQPSIDPVRIAGRYLFTGCHFLEEEVVDLIPTNGHRTSLSMFTGGLPAKAASGRSSTKVSGGSSERRANTSRARSGCSIFPPRRGVRSSRPTPSGESARRRWPWVPAPTSTQGSNSAGGRPSASHA